MENTTPKVTHGVAGLIKRLLTPERLRLLRFCIVGASGVVVNLAAFEVAFMAFSFVVSNSIGIAVSIFTNFMLNDRWTWADRAKKPFWHRLSAFYLVSLSAAAVQLGFSYACYEWLEIQRHLSLLIGIAAATGINFVTNNVWTFRGRDT